MGGSPGLVVSEETHNHKVVSSNPDAGYWMDNFTSISCKICIISLKKTVNFCAILLQDFQLACYKIECPD